MNYYEVTWTQTHTVRMKANVLARTRYEAIDLCASGHGDEEVVDDKIDTTRNWQAEEVEQDRD